MTDYERYGSSEVPVIWQICTYNLNEVSRDLRGVTFNALGYINPSQWYFVKSISRFK